MIGAVEVSFYDHAYVKAFNRNVQKFDSNYSSTQLVF